MTEGQWIPDPELIALLEKAVNNAKDPANAIVASGKHSWSMQDILNEVRNGTEFGRKYHVAWERLKGGFHEF